ncbi:Non-specific ribonucleoside hydrolase RihC [Thermoflexales bacterium]|nr:Non-specific ribonucleoside hydrolase RihC [Thermoflexales bacterium]
MRKKMLWFIIVLALIATSLAPAPAFAGPPKPLIPIVVDTDLGVDDAAALAYLLNQRKANILGITTVAGNTSVENAANNTLILLEAANQTDIPVVIGAAAPLAVPASHQGMFIHGPDGLWGLGYANPHDLSGLSQDAVGFLCANAQAGVTLLALGPVTNIAQAVQTCPDQMALYKIVWLGGGKSVSGEGNTPVSAFNAWFDPEATEVVLNAGLQLTMVTTDAARAVTLSPDVFTQLARHGNTLGKLVAGPLQMYASVVTQSASAPQTNALGEARSSRLYTALAGVRSHFNGPQVALFDPTAAVLVMHPEYVTTEESGLLVVDPAASFATRGQTVVALTMQEKLSTIADDVELSALADQALLDPNFDLYAALFEILMRQPDNAQVVMKVSALRVKLDWLKALLF